MNAVIDALAQLGVTSLDMPASCERVWRALNAGRKNGPALARPIRERPHAVHPRMHEVFVAGGTGYIGSRLIAALAARGHRVCALAGAGAPAHRAARG